MTEALIHCENLVKIYKAADLEVVALQGLDLEIMPGEMMAIVGASGSGKSTLLNILGGLDEASAGTCIVAGHDLARFTNNQRSLYRSFIVGHIWQQSGRNLQSEFTIAQNIDLPQMLNGIAKKARTSRTHELLEMIEIAHLARKKPRQLSGGEQQRAALAVALANSPQLLLADEPTGALDSTTAQHIITFMRKMNQQFQTTILIVTHDVAVAAAVDRTIVIRDGRTSTETLRRSLVASSSEMSNGISSVIGLSKRTHRESIVIDRAGRLQLPKEIMDTLDFQGRVSVELVGDHVELRPLTPE